MSDTTRTKVLLSDVVALRAAEHAARRLYNNWALDPYLALKAGDVADDLRVLVHECERSTSVEVIDDLKKKKEEPS